MLDIIFIVVVSLMIGRVTTMKSLGDLVGCFGAGFFMYCLLKMPFHLAVGGLSWPVSPDPNHHLISSIISVLIWVGLLEWTYQKKVKPKSIG